jgi:hypothetical protein
MGLLKFLEDYNERNRLRYAPQQMEYGHTISFNPIAQNGDRICATVYILFRTADTSEIDFIVLDLTRNVQAQISQWAIGFIKGEKAATGSSFSSLAGRLMTITSRLYKLHSVQVISITPVKPKATSQPLSTVEAMIVNILTLQEFNLFVKNLPIRHPDLFEEPESREQIQRFIEAKRLELLGD